MKSLIVAGLVAGLSLVPYTSRAAANEPADFGFEKIAAAEHGQYVEVDLDQGLLKMAALFADAHEKEAAQILRGLKHVHVHVLSLDNANRAAAVERVQQVRKSLATEGWKQIVTVRENKSDDVAVFARTRGEEAIEGVVVTVISGDNEAVLVHVTGDIKPEQIAALGARLDIDPLKKIKVAKN